MAYYLFKVCLTVGGTFCGTRQRDKGPHHFGVDKIAIEAQLAEPVIKACLIRLR
jgi:hypothetical protein